MKIGFIALKNILLGEHFIDLWTSQKEVNAYKRLYTCPNLGLLTVAGLVDDSFEVKYVDENQREIDFDEDFDVVCLSPVAQQVSNAYHVAKEFMARGVKVVIGGIHATVATEEVKEHCDCVMAGEGEVFWQEFQEDLKKGELKPIYRSYTTAPADLTKSPVPRYDLLENPEYYRVISVQVTRGCPRDCEFCASSKLYGKSYRRKTVEQVIREVRKIKEIWKKPYIYFTDDNLFVDREFSKKLLTELIPLKIRWYAFSDISIGEDDELLELMARSGCTQVTFGLESLSAESLGSVSKWKKRYLSKYPELIENIQSHGIGAFGSFCVGLDEDDTSVFPRIRDFVINNHLFGTSFSILTPFPGTILHEKLKKENRILDYNWDHYTCFDVVYQPKKMTVQELEEGFRWLYQEIYSEYVTNKRLRYFSEIMLKRGEKLRSEKK
ncbi:MAG TPA: B12-binding domain-containing radical SAM protein [Lachnospiraceae bacterium]|nr:radical SAM protein [uncultured Lachnoclostridium sp.]HAU86236.1 B12-binding domain-containing radical SAM protein [Lachnospiraceae bacterium]